MGRTQLSSARNQLKEVVGISLAFSPDAKILVVGNAYSVAIWDMISEPISHTVSAVSLAFSPDGTVLALGGEDKLVRLWDMVTQSELIKFKGHTEEVTSVSFSPNRKTLASGSKDKTVRLWDMVTQSELIKFKGHTEKVTSVSFSPDGKILASGSEDKTVYLWNTINQKKLTELKGHTQAVLSLAFHPSGQILASGGDDSNILVWHANADSTVWYVMWRISSYPTLIATAADLTGAHISQSNYELLKQNGAIGRPSLLSGGRSTYSAISSRFATTTTSPGASHSTEKNRSLERIFASSSSTTTSTSTSPSFHGSPLSQPVSPII